MIHVESQNNIQQLQRRRRRIMLGGYVEKEPGNAWNSNRSRIKKDGNGIGSGKRREDRED
jgi:hypothetical protein